MLFGDAHLYNHNKKKNNELNIIKVREWFNVVTVVRLFQERLQRRFGCYLLGDIFVDVQFYKNLLNCVFISLQVLNSNKTYFKMIWEE